VRREWFELTCASLFDARNSLFTSFSDSQQALVHPNPQRPPHLKLKHYEFAGKVVGKCLYESALGGSYRQLVRARFTRSFLAQIIGLRVHYKVRKIFKCFYSKTNKMHQFSKFILFFVVALYVFHTVFPSIIRSLRLYIQHQVYVKQILLTAC